MVDTGWSLPARVAQATVFTATDRPVQRHVDYVTEETEGSISPLEFVIDVLSDPVNLLLVGGAALGIIGVVVGYFWFRPAARDVHVLRETVEEYTDLVPWMLRLSLGLPLVGAGFAGYFFSPVVPAPTRLFQVAVGFLLLFGLATRFVALIGLLAYLIGVVLEPELLLASEYLGGFLAVILLGSGRPSADQMLQQVAATEGTLYGQIDPIHRIATRFNAVLDPYKAYAPMILRIGLGLNFVYLGISEKLLQPERALRVVQKYDLTSVVPVDPGMWVLGAGLMEVTVGTALVLGFLTRGVSAVAFTLFTLTLFGLPDDPVLAHVTLFGMASALFITGSGPLAVDSRIHGTVTVPETSVEG